MDYSLFLGAGPAGPLEVFTAACGWLIEEGTALDDAVSEAYEIVKWFVEREIDELGNPFYGYGIPYEFNTLFGVYHPKELYETFARLVFPGVTFPIIAAEGDPAKHAAFRIGLGGLAFADKIQPTKLRFGHFIEGSFYNLERDGETVEEYVKGHGRPKLIAGSHFISIAYHMGRRAYLEGELSYIPHTLLCSLMSNDTEVLFIEEGRFISNDGRIYSRFAEGNGIQHFAGLAADVFHRADAQHRSFAVDVYPKRLVDEYDRAHDQKERALIHVRVAD